MNDSSDTLEGEDVGEVINRKSSVQQQSFSSICR